MKNFKKLTAISSILAILLTNSISFAANSAINDATATAAGFTTTSKITITSTWNFADWEEISSATITNLDWSATTNSTTLTADWDNADSNTSILTIATWDLENNKSYIISFTTVDGDFGTTTLKIGTPTDDRIGVSARVQPILKFALESTSMDLGTLSTTFKSETTWIEVWTNAVGWVTVSAQSTNGWLESTTASHTINKTWNDALYAAESYEFESTPGTADSTSWATITWASSTAMNTAGWSITIYDANKPQNFDTSWDYDADFTVKAKIAESTPTASDYSDVIVFTATARF